MPAPETSKIAIVTGSASGIGRAIAIKLAEEGYDVALFDLPSSAKKLQSASEEIQAFTRKRVMTITGDVSMDEDVEALVERVTEEWGGLDVMIANAGVAVIKPMQESTAADLDAQMAINVRGTFLCYKYAARQMIRQGRGGRIVGASSVAGKKGLPNGAIYSASKFAVRGLTQSAAQEYGQYGITVNTYAPGCIDTPLTRTLDHRFSTETGAPEGSLKTAYKDLTAMKRIGTPQEVANLVSFFISERASYVTGQSWNVDGGMEFD